VTIEITGTVQRQAWKDNVLPPVEQVRPGLWSIPVPIPDNPLRYVLVYALELRDGVAVVDTGWSTEEAWRALTDGLGTAGYAVSDVRGALITHIHPDHYGLAGRLRAASDCWVALHPADAAQLPQRYGADINMLLTAMRGLLAENGVPHDVVAELSEASMGIREFVSLTEPDVFLEHGGRVDLPGWDMVALHTPGHSAGHCCFHDRGRRLLLSGDHVLPRISPNIAVHAQQVVNPLADFLESLHGIRDLDVDEVLPAHEWRFRPLRARADELIAHHRRRLDETLDQVRANGMPITCWDLTRRLRWSRDWAQITGFMRRAAIGETLAHLHLLETEGRIRRQPGSPVRWEPAQDRPAEERPGGPEHEARGDVGGVVGAEVEAAGPDQHGEPEAGGHGSDRLPA
jgi:glyoxylase-like metal-dependent hydrolase (beta-lactamase superfamily II)